MGLLSLDNAVRIVWIIRNEFMKRELWRNQVKPLNFRLRYRIFPLMGLASPNNGSGSQRIIEADRDSRTLSRAPIVDRESAGSERILTGECCASLRSHSALAFDLCPSSPNSVQASESQPARSPKQISFTYSGAELSNRPILDTPTALSQHSRALFGASRIVGGFALPNIVPKAACDIDDICNADRVYT